MGRELVNGRKCTKKPPNMVAIKHRLFRFKNWVNCVLYYIFQLNMLLCIEYILLFKLIIYLLYSFTLSFSTFYLGLLFTHTMARVNTLSNLPATYNLNAVIKHSVYSTLKSKSMAFYRHHLVFLHSLPFPQLALHKLNKGSHLILGQVILLPVSMLNVFSPLFI